MSPQILRRAKAYPFTIPSRSYVVAAGAHEELGPDAAAPDISGRRPVLAVGSNQSPEQLSQKFSESGWAPIPVIRARLKDFDIVYSPHVASYGSIPATLAHSPGTTVSLFVNWLTPEQEERMHETEVSAGNYHFGKLDGIELDLDPDLDSGPALTSAFVYISRRGAFLRDGVPVALRAIHAENRRWPALHQEEIQRHARDRCSPDQPLDAFILAAVENASVRKERTEAMMSESAAFDYSDFTPIEV